MGFTCCIPGCRTGYRNWYKKKSKKVAQNSKENVDGGNSNQIKKLEEPEKISIFAVRQVHVENFANLLHSKLNGVQLKAGKDHVCALHFRKEDIDRGAGLTVVNGVEIDLRRKPFLKDEAIPVYFPGDENSDAVETGKSPGKRTAPLSDCTNKKLKLVGEINRDDENRRDYENEESMHVEESIPYEQLPSQNPPNFAFMDVMLPDAEGTGKSPGQREAPLSDCMEENLEHVTEINGDEEIGTKVEDNITEESMNIQENIPQEELPFENQPYFDFKHLAKVLPSTAWGVHEFPNYAIICKLEEKYPYRISHNIKVNLNGSVDVTVNERPIRTLCNNLLNMLDLETLVKRIDNLQLCQGTDSGEYSADCIGWVLSKRALRCPSCKSQHKTTKRKQNKSRKKHVKGGKPKQELAQARLRNLRKSLKTAKAQVVRCQKRVASLRRKCEAMTKNQVDEILKGFESENERLVVQSIITAAKTRNPKNRRYALDWVFHCMLMRIKSPKLYDHIRARKILPLPDRTSINRYMTKLRPAYGFQKSLFDVLTKKTASWSELERHGVILVDEVKLQPGTDFDRNTLLQWGFVDMGEFTPEDQKEELGDHALVVLFQPFAGGWVQTLGCFLSKGNVKGDVLAKIILEGITLSEKAGLRVDGIVTDGAKWNRNMWTQFGIGDKQNDDNSSKTKKKKRTFPDTADEYDVNASCTHPSDDNRHLWFFSDWCHLLKNMRNTICPEQPKSKKGRTKKPKQGQVPEPEPPSPPPVNTHDPKTYLQRSLQTPDGTVKRIHWVAVWNEEEKRLNQSQLRCVPKLTKTALFPNGFERMNVGLAFTFFSNAMRAGMQRYHNLNIKELEDCHPTLRLLERVHNVAKAMNSGNSAEGFRRGSQSEQAIEEFLDFHKKCRHLARSKPKNKYFWSDSTDLGLHVSLKSALELSHYLIDEIKFNFVMTKRFNQDAIEHFFGNIRQMAFPNQHPDPKLFVQLYRLLSVYSLVSPAKKSNVSGVENVQALLDAEDEVGAKNQERREEFNNILDEILELGTPLASLPVAMQREHSYDLDLRAKFDEQLTSFMAGFTAFRRKKIVGDCTDCLDSLTKPRSDTCPRDNFALTKECYGGYTFPSEELVNLVDAIEKAVGICVRNHRVHKDIMFTTLKYLVIKTDCFVGCLNHRETVTKEILEYYLIVRLFFASDMKNQQVMKDKKRRTALRKQSKL